METIAEWAVKHQLENPTHGYNCHCADTVIQGLRRGNHPSDPRLDKSQTEDALRRVQYIFTQAGKVWGLKH